MPKISNPYGFKLVYAKESNLSAGLQTFPICSGETGSIFSGDPVAFVPANPGGFLSVAPLATVNATTGAVSDRDPIVGIFGGCTYTPSGAGGQLTRSPYWRGGMLTKDDNYAYGAVNDHKSMVWQVQTNGPFAASAYTIGNATTSKTPVGLNYDFVLLGQDNVGGNESTGQSRAALNVKTNAAASTASAFKIIGLAPVVDNNWGDDFVDVYVMINYHYMGLGSSCRVAALA